MKLKTNYKAIFLILLSSILLGIIYNTFSSDGIDFIRKEIKIDFVKIGESNSKENLKGINISQALELHNKKSAIFIDARDQWEFSESHITRALNIPEFSFSNNDKTLSNISKKSTLVIYCDGDDCDTSKRLAKQISELGYENIYVFLGGMKLWMEAELPTSKGN
ncbi:MAG: rhodanese-like domain-containing protein [Ignavibacteriae bacterium]|nr:rhodanese-like domain-containing protein [Ignavibacteriota bacterium]